MNNKVLIIAGTSKKLNIFLYPIIILSIILLLACIICCLDGGYDLYVFGVSLFIPLAGSLSATISILLNKKNSITVEEDRIYGTTVFKRVDLPIDAISAVGTAPFDGIAIATSGGKISFKFIDNRDKVVTLISELYRNRANASNRTSNNAPQTTTADELKKYKELLDSGAITQEEFDTKKKQILGI